MKKFILLVILLSAPAIFAQSVDDPDLPGTTDQFSLNLVFTSIEYEKSISQFSTIDGMVKFGFAYHDASYLDEPEYGVFPFLELGYRRYYNFQNRIAKAKKVSENSGNYLGGIVNVGGGDPLFGNMDNRMDFFGMIGPVWGLQRVYNSNIKLNLNLGVAYTWNNFGEQGLAPIVGFQLGYKFGK